MNINDDTLTDEYQAKMVKEYYERSLYATVLRLENGRFLVHNHVTGKLTPCLTWDDAKNTRYEIAHRYWEMDKVFMGGREAYAFLTARNAIV